MTTRERQKRIEKAQMRTLFVVPFFAPAVAKLPVRIVDKEDDYRKRFGTPGHCEATACTDGKQIHIFAGYLDKLTDQQLVTLICHEVCHPMLGHLWRMPPGADNEDWNIACDHAVNLMLKRFSAAVTAKNLADPFPFPEPVSAYCADPQFENMPEEQIYQRVKRPPGGSGGNGKPGKGKAGGKPGNSSMPGFGQFQPQTGPKADPAAQKKLQQSWANTLLQCAQIAESRGDLPAGMERIIDRLTNPAVNWWDVLRSLLREQCSDDWDFQRPSLEYSDSGFMLPSLHSEKCGDVVFATDTSGSIDNDMLAAFQTEKQNCLDEMRPKRLLDIYCDSQIHKVADYATGDVISKEAPGGGGTSFVPVWEYLDKLDAPPKAVVYLTDLYGDFGSDPGVPVIWVTWTKPGTVEVPFGQVVYVERN